ncbi:ABC transporter substrate-binding protein [Seinonella peptonophila]|uniref:ABC transporter substrate-binding protein n=1 Tax=Seinonella peptonophila TaxID=112248 RepID=UPI0009342CEB|nr:ABC transporter substrate-binding protein [Seinonella peptonophila]
MRKWSFIICLFLLVFVTACSKSEQSNQLEPVTVVLDWTPNTNHTGLYVAKAKGYFKEQGLDVKMMQPESVTAEQLVAKGKANFGISTQESLTFARMQGIPLVSIAAIIQHNTSGFASTIDKKIDRPKAFAGKVYGGFGSPVEKPIIDTLMKQDGAASQSVRINNVGNVDFFHALKKGIDFMWIYQGWTGIEAELRGLKLNMVYLTDYSKDLDYYTPILATNEQQIKKDPATVKKFMAAVSKGYQFAIQHPEQAADILIKEEKDLNPALVKKSQLWLSKKYQDDAAVWGWQKKEVWENYTNWLRKNQLIKGKYDPNQAYTNQFIPQKAK